MLQRYDMQWLRDFRDPIELRTIRDTPAEEEAPAPPPAPSFSEAELAQAQETGKKLGYAEGFEAGLLQSLTEQTQREKDMVAALAKVGDALHKLNANYGAFVAEQSTDLADLIYMIARKVAGDALDERGMETVLALVRQCLPIFYEKPRVTIELHPLSLDNAKELLKPFLQKQGFEGDVFYRSNEAIGKHDVKVEWANGEAVRSTDSLWRDIELLMQSMSLTPQFKPKTT